MIDLDLNGIDLKLYDAKHAIDFCKYAILSVVRWRLILAIVVSLV